MHSLDLSHSPPAMQTIITCQLSQLEPIINYEKIIFTIAMKIWWLQKGYMLWLIILFVNSVFVCVAVCVYQLCSHCSTTRIYTHRYPLPHPPNISPIHVHLREPYPFPFSSPLNVVNISPRQKSLIEHPLLSKRNKLGKCQSAVYDKGKGKDWRKVDGRFLRSWAAALLLSPRFSSAQPANRSTGKEVQFSNLPLFFTLTPNSFSIFV